MVTMKATGGNTVKVLAIGAHPDDIEPQIGGTLAKYAQESVVVSIVSAMSTSTGASSFRSRDLEGKMAAKTIGANHISLGFDPDEFCLSRLYIGEFDKLIKSEEPDFVFSVSNKDSHHEHQIVFSCVQSALRRNSVSWVSLNQVFPGGIASHKHNFYSNITKTQSIKMEAVKCYESQIEKYGVSWLEGIAARDRAWGFNINCEYAEVAEIKKWIVKD